MRSIIRYMFVFFLAGFLGTASAQQEKKTGPAKENVDRLLNNPQMVDHLLTRFLENETLRRQMLEKLAAEMENNSEMKNELEKLLKQKKASATKAAQAQEVLVRFEKDVTVAQTKSLEKDLGLNLVKEIPQLNIKVYQVGTRKPLKDVLEYCNKQPFVKYAEPNQTYHTMR